MKVKSTVFLAHSGPSKRKSSSPSHSSVSPAEFVSPARSPDPFARLDAEGTKIWFVTPGKLESSHSAEGAAAVAWKERERERKLQNYGFIPPNPVGLRQSPAGNREPQQGNQHERSDGGWTTVAAYSPAVPLATHISTSLFGSKSGNKEKDSLPLSGSTKAERYPVLPLLQNGTSPYRMGSSSGEPSDSVKQQPSPTPLEGSAMNESFSSRANVTNKARIFENLAKHKQEEQERTYHHQAAVTPPKKSYVSRAQTFNLAQFQSFGGPPQSDLSPEVSSEQRRKLSESLTIVNKRKIDVGTRNEVGDERGGGRDGEVEDSGLSVWEKMKLFEKKIQEHGQKLYRRGMSRFQTQPITPDEVRAAVVSIKGSAKKRQAPQPPGFTQPSSPEGSGTSERSTLERVKARRVVHLHTEDSASLRDKSESPGVFGGGTTEDSLSESSTNNPQRGYPHKKYWAKSSQPESESSSAAEDSKRGIPDQEVAMIETEGRLSIGERLAALKGQEEDWRRRVSKEKGLHTERDVVYLRSRSGAEESSQKLTDRVSALMDSQAKWTQRVSQKDTDALTVGGKLLNAGLIPSPKSQGRLSPEKETPPPQKPIRASKIPGKSGPAPAQNGSENGTRVSMLPRLDAGLDEFYRSENTAGRISDIPKIDPGALDAVLSLETPKLAVSKNIKPPRRRTQSTPRNPVRHLAQSEIVEKSYDEKASKTPLVQFRRPPAKNEESQGDTPKRPYSATLDPYLKPGNRGTQLATEALRALAAKEDFGAVKLRKADPSRTPGQAPEHRPYKETMLLQVKGRKNVLLRLVEPSWKSLNSGDCFLLLTSDNLFFFQGRFSNVLERAKAKEVANFIVETKDMGCLGSSRVIEMDEESLLVTEEARERLSPSRDRFWSLLGGGSVKEVRVPADLEEDRMFEERVCGACVVYKVVSPNHDSVYKLQLSEEYTGSPLQHHMLNEDQVWVFDFGCELYVWNGRSVPPDARRAGVKLAKEMIWDRPFDKTLVGTDPFQVFEATESEDDLDVCESRPDWCLFGQVKDKMETSLFRGKFLDWPEMRSTNSLSVQSELMMSLDSRSPSPSKMTKKQILAFKDPSTIELSPEELGRQLFSRRRKEPELIVGDQSVGRGHDFIRNSDSKLNKFQVISDKVTMYHVSGSAEPPMEMSSRSFAQFHMEDCYIIRWDYRVCYADARSLSGEESKHAVNETGRGRAAFFYWHGMDSSRGDQGACALGIRDLDPDHNPQVRVTQGLEPPAFLNLFGGRMAVHRGKKGRRRPARGWRLYAQLGGPFPTESCLVEVDPDPDISLRPQGVFLLTSIERNVIWAWIGGKSSVEMRKSIGALLTDLKESSIPLDFGFTKTPSIRESVEGEEPAEWLKSFGVSERGRLKYPRPSPSFHLRGDCVRLFRFTSTSNKEFSAVEAVSSWYSREETVAFPFEQDDLYGGSQPAFFLLDEGGRVWLWEGWVEEEESGEDESVAQKLRLARLFALKTTVAYCHAKEVSPEDDAYVVYAGLEPKEFKALFPVWNDQEEATEANVKAMRAPGTKRGAMDLLSELSVSVYPAARLKEKPLPEGVDGSRLESYLNDEEFMDIFCMSRQAFYDLPPWKQVRLRKESHLF